MGQHLHHNQAMEHMQASTVKKYLLGKEMSQHKVSQHPNVKEYIEVGPNEVTRSYSFGVSIETMATAKTKIDNYADNKFMIFASRPRPSPAVQPP
nr:hypothetical protein CFP56_47184 [Quercus suber]